MARPHGTLASRLQGHLDVALNETGRLQADRLAQALAGERIDAIYASDLTRARHTARPLAARRWHGRAHRQGPA